MRKMRVLHDGEISIEIARPAKAISTLGKSHWRSSTRIGSVGESSLIESSFAACLHKACVRIRRTITKNLRRLARMHGVDKTSTASTVRIGTEWPRRNGINWTKIILRLKNACLVGVENRIRKATMKKDRPRYLPPCN